MSLKRRFVVAALVLVGASCLTEARAGFWSRFNPFARLRSKQQVETLLITGNFGKSRILAELAQAKKKHPILLISPEADGDRIFFLPTAPEAASVAPDRFREFIEFLQPKRVVILGDERYVPERYTDELRGRFPLVVVDGEDWRKNATALGGVLGYRRLARRYEPYLQKWELAADGSPVPAGSVAKPSALDPAGPYLQPAGE